MSVELKLCGPTYHNYRSYVQLLLDVSHNATPAACTFITIDRFTFQITYIVVRPTCKSVLILISLCVCIANSLNELKRTFYVKMYLQSFICVPSA
jgi:hypothetical protein